MIDKKQSLQRVIELLGNKWDADNVLDLVLDRKINLYVRKVEFISKTQDRKIKLKNEKIWSSNNFINETNIEAIRTAIYDELKHFKLVVSDEQILKWRESSIKFELERYKTESNGGLKEDLTKMAATERV